MQLPYGCFSISLGTLSHNGRCVCVLKQGSLRLPLSYHSLHWRCNMEQVTSHKHCHGNRASPNRTQAGCGDTGPTEPSAPHRHAPNCARCWGRNSDRRRQWHRQGLSEAENWAPVGSEQPGSGTGSRARRARPSATSSCPSWLQASGAASHSAPSGATRNRGMKTLLYLRANLILCG